MSQNIVDKSLHTAIDNSFDALAPLSSRALFWRAGYVADSPFLDHIPLLFWIVENARPKMVVSLGVADAVPYFAACQAIEKLNIDALCLGVDPGSDSSLDPVMAHNAQHYPDFSEIVTGTHSKVAQRLHNGAIDLLIVNEPVTQALADELDRHWLPLLSDRASVLFARGGDAAVLPGYADRIALDGAVFVVGAGTDIRLALRGTRHDDRLMRLARLQPGKPGYLGVRNVFARLGELHRATFEKTQADRALRSTRKQRDKAVRKLKDREKQLARGRAVLAEMNDSLKATEETVTALRSDSLEDRHARAALETELAESTAATGQMRAELEHLEQAHKQKDALAIGLREECRTLQGAWDTARTDTDQRFGELARMTRMLEERDRKMQDQNRLIQDRNRQMKERDKNLARLKQTNEVLRRERLRHKTVMHLLEPKEKILNAMSKSYLSGRYWKMRGTLKSQIAEIGKSGFFDAAWYRKTYADVATSSISPIEHFVRSGAYEGRNPGPGFDSMKYHLANPEVAAQKMPALLHYLHRGKAEGRKVFPVSG